MWETPEGIAVKMKCNRTDIEKFSEERTLAMENTSVFQIICNIFQINLEYIAGCGMHTSLSGKCKPDI